MGLEDDSNDDSWRRSLASHQSPHIYFPLREIPTSHPGQGRSLKDSCLWKIYAQKKSDKQGGIREEANSCWLLAHDYKPFWHLTPNICFYDLLLHSMLQATLRATADRRIDT